MRTPPPPRGNRPPGVVANATIRADGDGADSGARRYPRYVQLRTQRVMVRAPQPVGRGTTLRLPTNGAPQPEDDRSRHGHGAARSGRQPVTALGPTRLQDGSAGARAHPLTEPVLLGPTAVVRLKGALHPCLLISANTLGTQRPGHVLGVRPGCWTYRLSKARAGPLGTATRARPSPIQMPG